MAFPAQEQIRSFYLFGDLYAPAGTIAPGALAWLGDGKVVQGDAFGFVDALSNASGMPPVAHFYTSDSGAAPRKTPTKEAVAA